jgi:preprotein translocase subunit YajC
MLLWNDAWAQAAAPGGKPYDANTAFLVQMFYPAIMLVILYLLVIEPSRRRSKQTKDMLTKLKKGDRVVTSGGIIGTVVGIDDSKTTLKIADDVRVEFTKSAVVQVLGEETKSK